ncbi:hypothetical protein DL96DRAFT_1634619 [Flagelloscypha sp. PMI_526]|nr:hypothetical protein DL96DRAFT_1634619 [Flagelloscypha sp. PMI_526]
MTEQIGTDTHQVISTPHGKFNASDADIAIISSDHVLFRIHSKNLAFSSSNAVPDMNNAPKGEDCYWEETSEVLETFFAFIYFDGPHPDLTDKSIEMIQVIGRLAHKWGVPHATAICKLQMLLIQERLLRQHPPPKELLQTFDYLTEYHGRELADVLDHAAMYTLRFPVVEAKQLLSYSFQPWVCFRLLWVDGCIFRGKQFGRPHELQERSQDIVREMAEHGWQNIEAHYNRSRIMRMPRFSATLRNEI